MAGLLNLTNFNTVSAWSSTSTVEKARSDLDEKLAILRRAEREILSCRNSLSRICSLPPEILSFIFLHIVNDPTGNTLCGCCHTTNWLNFSHVCRHWRDVSLSCPGLWTKLTTRSLPFTEEMIKRSKRAPLYVFANLIYQSTATAAHERALDEVSRIRELDISLSMHTTNRVFGKLSHPAPLLRSLIISNTTLPYGLAPNEPRTLVPNNFLGESTPSLRKLRLRHCDLPWDLPILKDLTELDIEHVSPGARPTNRQILNVLRNMPALRRLALADALPTSASVPGEEIVHLSGLQQLRVSGPPSECSQFLSHLEFPQTTEIKLYCNAGNDSFAPIVPFLTQKCFAQVNVEEPQETLHISGFSRPYIDLQIRLCSLDSSLDYDPFLFEGCRVFIELRRSHNSEATHATILRDIFAQATLNNVRTIQVREFSGVSEEMWRALLTSAPSTKTLDVACVDVLAVSDLVSVLDTRDTPEPAFKNVMLPGLEELVLRNVEFEDEEQEPSFMYPSVELEDFHEFLVARVNSNAGLGKLVLRECFNFNDEHQSYLEEVVPYVDWDWIERDTNTEIADENEDEDDYYDDGYDFNVHPFFSDYFGMPMGMDIFDDD